MTASPLAFGPLLKSYRRDAGLSQEALAERAGYSAVYIRKLEGGDRIPARAAVDILAHALDLPESDRQLLRAAARQAGRPAEGLPLDRYPLVGRTRELELIERHLAGVGPPVLFIAGEPGAGKTRLLRETVRRAAERGIVVLEAGCHPHSRQEPFTPLGQALADGLHRLAASQQRRALRESAWLSRLLPELIQSGLVTPPAPLPPEQERRLIFTAAARFIANSAGTQGALLLVDDLQWAGQDAIELLVALAGQTPRIGLRIVGAYRDTEVDADDPLDAGLSELLQGGLLTQLPLASLAPDEAADLVDHLMAGAAEELKQRVLQRGEGLPLFLVSLADGLRSGALYAKVATGVPFDLLHSIRQRIAVLPPAAQEVARLAAVAGRQISLPVLRGATGLNETALADALDALSAAHVLVEGSASTYRFSHDLIREAVEQDLGPARRSLLHARIAAALERQHAADPSPVADTLAYHYVQAHEPERAITYLELAGDRALALCANAAAEGHYRQLASLAQEMGNAATRARSGEKLGIILSRLARYDDALAALDDAAHLYRTAGDLESWVRTVAQAGRTHAARGSTAAGIMLLEMVAAALGLGEAPASLGSLYVALAQLYFASGKYREELVAAERASELAHARGDLALAVEADVRLGTALSHVGRRRDGMEPLDRAIALGERIGHLMPLARALNNRARMSIVAGDFLRARSYAQRGLEVAEKLGDPATIAHLTFSLGFKEFYLGNWPRARELLERARELGSALGPSWHAAYPIWGLGLLTLHQGDLTEAARLLEESMALAERSGDLQILQHAARLLAECDLLRGQPVAALSHIQRFPPQEGVEENMLLATEAWVCLELGEAERARRGAEAAIMRARQLEDQETLLDALRVGTLVLLTVDKLGEAEQLATEGLSLARSMPYPFEEGRLLALSGRIALTKGDVSQGLQHLQAAAEVFHRLGARLHLAQTEQATVSAAEKWPERAMFSPPDRRTLSL